MSIKKIIDMYIDQAQGQIIGTTASPFYQLYDDSSGWVWAVDVDIGQPEVLRAVPVATNNRDLFYAEQGKAVALRREGGRWVVVGLSKTGIGTQHILYVCFTDDIPTIVDEETRGYIVRALTYGELAAYGGYGVVPYGAQARFDAAGNFVEFL
jgi:hypothetical protein